MEFHPIIVAAAVIFMVTASVSDFRERKITNRLNVAGALTGLVLQALLVGSAGVVAGLHGLVVGLLILFLPFAAGMVGGGDVKFVAAAGTFLGWKVLLLGLAAGMILGGIAAAIALLMNGRFGAALKSLLADLVCLSSGVRPTTLKSTQAVETIPYGVLLATGMAGALAATLLRWVPWVSR
jgi:prepilin peptidase CpaA